MAVHIEDQNIYQLREKALLRRCSTVDICLGS